MKTLRTTRTASGFGLALLALTIVGMVVGCGGGGNDDSNDQGLNASATLLDTGGRNVGTARFIQERASAPVTIRIQVTGLAPGLHGIHIHGVGRAEPNANPPFSTSGVHFNPTNREHGLQNPNGPHAGDLQNLIISGDDAEIFTLTTDRVTLFGNGGNSLFDGDGSSIILHANADNQRTDPDGGVGARLVGGVVARD